MTDHTDLIARAQRHAEAYPETVFPADSGSTDAIAGTALRTISVPLVLKLADALEAAQTDADKYREFDRQKTAVANAHLKELVKLEAENQQLRDALGRYGMHLPSCVAMRTRTIAEIAEDIYHLCDCGWDHVAHLAG